MLWVACLGVFGCVFGCVSLGDFCEFWVLPGFYVTLLRKLGAIWSAFGCFVGVFGFRLLSWGFWGFPLFWLVWVYACLLGGFPVFWRVSGLVL